MAHARKQIRDAVVTTLTGLTTTGADIHDTRLYPHEMEHLPSLNVTVGTDIPIDDSTDLGPKIARVLEVIVQARAKPLYEDGSGETVEDQLDKICTEVEVAMAADISLGGKVKYLQIGTTAFDFSDEQERPLGMATMTYEMEYSVLATDPETIVT